MLRASYGIFYGRQNMLTQVGSITDNGVQQFGIAALQFSSAALVAAGRPTWPEHSLPYHRREGFRSALRCACSVKDYANPRIYTTNVSFEQEIAQDLSCTLTSLIPKAFI